MNPAATKAFETSGALPKIGSPSAVIGIGPFINVFTPTSKKNIRKGNKQRKEEGRSRGEREKKSKGKERRKDGRRRRKGRGEKRGKKKKNRKNKKKKLKLFLYSRPF